MKYLSSGVSGEQWRDTVRLSPNDAVGASQLRSIPPLSLGEHELLSGSVSVVSSASL